MMSRGAKAAAARARRGENRFTNCKQHPTYYFSTFVIIVHLRPTLPIGPKYFITKSYLQKFSKTSSPFLSAFISTLGRLKASGPGVASPRHPPSLSVAKERATPVVMATATIAPRCALPRASLVLAAIPGSRCEFPNKTRQIDRVADPFPSLDPTQARLRREGRCRRQRHLRR